MPIDLEQLLAKSFFVERAEDATRAIQRAREQYAAATRTEGVSFEVMVPASPDEAWLAEHLVRPLVYYCESMGTPVPGCPGVFMSMFVGDRLHCIAAADVIDWARATLGLSAEEMRERWGTHESETALR